MLNTLPDRSFSGLSVRSLLIHPAFILRSGGKTLITFLFDSGFTWAVMVPVAWILVHLTSLDVRAIYLGVQATDLLKVTFGHVLIRRGVWLNNMVGEGAE